MNVRGEGWRGAGERTLTLWDAGGRGGGGVQRLVMGDGGGDSGGGGDSCGGGGGGGGFSVRQRWARGVTKQNHMKVYTRAHKNPRSHSRSLPTCGEARRRVSSHLTAISRPMPRPTRRDDTPNDKGEGRG